MGQKPEDPIEGTGSVTGEARLGEEARQGQERQEDNKLGLQGKAD